MSKYRTFSKVSRYCSLFWTCTMDLHSFTTKKAAQRFQQPVLADSETQYVFNADNPKKSRNSSPIKFKNDLESVWQMTISSFLITMFQLEQNKKAIIFECFSDVKVFCSSWIVLLHFCIFAYCEIFLSHYHVVNISLIELWTPLKISLTL